MDIAESTIAEIDTAIVAESITPTSPTPAPVDVTALRAEIEADKASLADKERTLTTAELEQAEAVHTELLQQCDTAQIAFDEINKQVFEQQSAFSRADSRRSNTSEAITAHRHNVPERRYGNQPNVEAWRNELSRLETEQASANTEYGRITSTLMRLQSERTEATKVLSDLSWKEGMARERASGLRGKLAAMTPLAATAAPNSFEPMLNGSTLEWSTDNSLPSDPRTRLAATRG